MGQVRSHRRDWGFILSSGGRAHPPPRHQLCAVVPRALEVPGLPTALSRLCRCLALPLPSGPLPPCLSPRSHPTGLALLLPPLPSAAWGRNWGGVARGRARLLFLPGSVSQPLPSFSPTPPHLLPLQLGGCGGGFHCEGGALLALLPPHLPSLNPLGPLTCSCPRLIPGLRLSGPFLAFLTPPAGLVRVHRAVGGTRWLWWEKQPSELLATGLLPCLKYSPG